MSAPRWRRDTRSSPSAEEKYTCGAFEGSSQHSDHLLAAVSIARADRAPCSRVGGRRNPVGGQRIGNVDDMKPTEITLCIVLDEEMNEATADEVVAHATINEWL
ncbi:hypothetical protein GCM10027187_73320 [Streptosporangium sandarakinum]